MAFNFIKQADGKGIPFNYTRGNPIPLDSWSLFMSYDDALSYAQSNPVSYPGQIISVLTDGQPKVYVIVSGSSYTQEDADSDAANKENPVEGYVNKIPSGKQVGDESQSTRTLVELGQQSSSGADMFWLRGDGSQL